MADQKEETVDKLQSERHCAWRKPEIGRITLKRTLGVTGPYIDANNTGDLT